LYNKRLRNAQQDRLSRGSLIDIILGLVAEFAFHGTVDKADDVRFPAARWMDRERIDGLEVPAWMFRPDGMP